MEIEPIKVVVDTNLWVSMAMGSQKVSEKMLLLIENININIFISSELIEELTETLAKPKLLKYLTNNRVKNLFDIIWQKAELVHVTFDLKICRDPKDDFIINLANEAKAYFIITGDDDLLVLNPIDNIQIITLTEFINRVEF